MKSVITTLALLASMSVATPALAEQPIKKDVTLTVSEVYVPGGFSQDTDAYVVVSGMFPNSCYSWSRAEVSNNTPMNHEVHFTASVAQAMCLMVMVPYQKEVSLGRLATGEHTLRFVNGDGTYFERTLKVE